MNDIAYILCGGNAQPIDAPATVRWTDYADMALKCGPNIRRAGLTRVLLHNPGGHFFLGWSPTPNNVHDPVPYEAAKKQGLNVLSMVPNQWCLAEQAGCPYADRDKLALGHHIFRYYGVKEVIYYLGTPAVFRDAMKEGPPAIEAFMDCGQGASVGFDALAWTGSRWKEGDDICRFFDQIRAAGIKVYVEPRMAKKQVDAGLGLYVDGTIAHTGWDELYKPDLSIQPGETIRDMNVVWSPGAPTIEGVTCMWRGANNWTEPAVK